jgi:hypothetical protein
MDVIGFIETLTTAALAHIERILASRQGECLEDDLDTPPRVTMVRAPQLLQSK